MSDLFGVEWERVDREDPRARALADRHYSRQTVGAAEFMPPGHTFVLLADGAVWGACENLDPAGSTRWRVTIFRNESPARSSDLIRAATTRTRDYWRYHFGPGRPGVELTTEVNPGAVRRKRDPGRCFLRAGWRVIDPDRRGLVILEAPNE